MDTFDNLNTGIEHLDFFNRFEKFVTSRTQIIDINKEDI